MLRERYDEFYQELEVIRDEDANKFIYLLTNKGRLTYEDIVKAEFNWLYEYATFVMAQLEAEKREVEKTK